MQGNGALGSSHGKAGCLRPALLLESMNLSLGLRCLGLLESVLTANAQ